MILGGISMITMLAKIFIKNRPAKEQRQAYGTLCSIVGICLNVCLFAGKYFAGMLSGSVAITADAFNNLSDAGSSFITLAGFLYAGKTPDSEHPFGHGRFEYVSGFVVAIAILMMGFELLKTSFSKILHPEAVDTSLLAMGILVCSILVKIYMYCYNHYIGKKLDSDAMQATAMDSLSDTIATVLRGRVELGKYPMKPKPDALDAHDAVADAIAKGEPERARSAMLDIVDEVARALNFF